MTRTVSIDCDPKEVRLAVGTSGLTGVSVEHVLSQSIELGPEEDYLESPRTVAAIQSLLKLANVRSGNAIVCIGRSSIELRTLQLPSGDRNELPDMVRFAAQRHFANVGDSWPIDYVTLNTNSEGMTEVLAATLNPAKVERIGKLLESNGLKLSQLVLRPMVASSVALMKRPELGSKPTLFIDIHRNEADMAIVEGRNVVFMRAIRFDASQDDASKQKALSGEIKRTLLAAVSQSSSLEVSQILIWGSAAETANMCEGLSSSLEIAVSHIDPFDLVDASSKAKQEAGMEQGRYAAVIGALLAPSNSQHLIDFCHPRKREEKKRPVLQLALAGCLAALLVGAGIYGYFSTHSELNSEIERLTKAVKDNENGVKLSNQKTADWKKIETFLAGNYSWIDELEFLSKKAAPPDKAIFNVTTFSIDSRTNNALVSTKFVMPEQELAPEIQNGFRDSNHVVRSSGVSRSPDKSGKYGFIADLNMKLAPLIVPDPRKGKDIETVSIPPSEKTSPNKETVPAKPSQEDAESISKADEAPILEKEQAPPAPPASNETSDSRTQNAPAESTSTPDSNPPPSSETKPGAAS